VLVLAQLVMALVAVAAVVTVRSLVRIALTVVLPVTSGFCVKAVGPPP